METFRRAKNVAIWGLVLQFLAAVVTLAIGLWTRSTSALTAGLFLATGTAVWLFTAFLYYLHQLRRQEEIELEDIASDRGQSGRIFEDDAQARPAARRLEWVERWMVPIFTGVWAVLHVLVVYLVFDHLRTLPPGEPASAARGALFLVVVGFPAFLFSRYASGMSHVKEWRLLRAPGSYLLVNVLFVGASAASLLLASQGRGGADRVIAYVALTVQVVLAVELVINLILELYRPRVPGQEERPSFDSRLFGLVAEPGRVGHSIAETLNYQFGFEVSRTWFYQLVSKTFLPLLVSGVVILFAISAVVIVPEGQEGLILHWGRLDRARGVLAPGAHLKWPWPIDRIELYRTSVVHEILLGAGRRRTREERIESGEFVEERNREIFLWEREHGRREELDFLIAVPPERGQTFRAPGEEPPPPVNIIKLVASVRYRISDLRRYAFNYANTDQLLEAIAYREMTRYCSSATLDSAVTGSTERPEAIMTFGRAQAARELKQRIQQAVGPDGADLGVEIVYVGLLSVHPPAGAAPAYSMVLEEERRQDARRYEAEARANTMLVEVGGDPITALQLSLAIRRLQQLENLTQLTDRPEVLRSLRGYVREAEGDVQMLDVELERERLLGTGRSEGLVRRRELLGVHREHLADLRALLAEVESGREPELDRRIETAERVIDRLFDDAAGEPAALIAQAQADRWETELSERGRSEAFSRQLLAYEASPRIYMLDRYLETWDEFLPQLAKTVLGVDPEKIEFWLNMERDIDEAEGTFESVLEQRAAQQ